MIRESMESSWGKYLTVAMAFSLALVWAYEVLGKAVRWQNRVGDSWLHLTHRK